MLPLFFLIIIILGLKAQVRKKKVVIALNKFKSTIISIKKINTRNIEQKYQQEQFTETPYTT